MRQNSSLVIAFVGPTFACAGALALALPSCGGDSATDLGNRGPGGSSGSGSGGTAGSGGATGGGSGGTPDDGGGQGGSGAGEGEPCDTYGVTREVPCGNCGQVTQTCASDGVWSNVNACSGESGECSAGATETSNESACETRTCDSECRWGAWQPMGDGCTPGAVDYDNEGCVIGELKKKTCSTTCTWEVTACANQCPGTRRTSPPEAEEICIPAGEFVRGDDGNANSMPIANVYVSSFYMDRYPVTNQRYRECVTAMACTEPSNGLGDSIARNNPVHGISKQQAVQFCAWDVEKLLPTEAQWEKAARGPAPRYAKYMWGDDPNCDPGTQTCPVVLPPNEYFDYNDQPNMRGFYGTEPMGGATPEWVRDPYSSDYYSTPESLSNPMGPSSGQSDSLRGYFFRGSSSFIRPIGFRSRPSDWIGPTFMFRCVRQVQ
jgi:formylglycine-generating enzyme required for sulfatase activity